MYFGKSVACLLTVGAEKVCGTDRKKEAQTISWLFSQCTVGRLSAQWVTIIVLYHVFFKEMEFPYSVSGIGSESDSFILVNPVGFPSLPQLSVSHGQYTVLDFLCRIRF